MPLQYQQLLLQDFSGGITDKFINANQNAYEHADNFLITEYKTLALRAGYGVVYEQETVVPIMGLFELNEEVFMFRSSDIYLMESTRAIYIGTPVGAVLPVSLQANIAGKNGNDIELVGDGVQNITTLVGLWNTANSSNQLSILLGGVEVPDDGVEINLAGGNEIGTATKAIKSQVNEPYLQNTGNTSYPVGIEWRNQLHVLNTDYNRAMRTWRDEFGNLKSVELGLPEFDGSTIEFSPEATGVTYLYAFHYSYTYKVGDVTFKNVGTVFQSKAVKKAVAIDAANPMEITGIIPLSTIAPLGHQLDLDSIKIEIYRTQADSTSNLLYLIHSTGEGITSYTDDNEDSAIVSNQTIYTAGGAVEHYQAPKAKSVTFVNDIAIWGGVIEETSSGDQPRPYRVQQSIGGIPSATHPTFIVDLDDDVVGLNHFRGIPMAFTDSYVYRLEGIYTSIGGGSMRPRSISSDAGCCSNNSIIRTDFGIFWAGRDGFYGSDGYQIDLLTKNLSKRFSVYTDTEAKRRRITGMYDKENERIYWAMSSNDVTNDKIWIYDIKHGAFTTMSGIQMHSTSLMYNKNRILRGDESGYIYEHSEEHTSDLKRDTSSPVKDWFKNYVPYNFVSVAYDFGNPHVRKWVQQATFSISAPSDAAITPRSINDENESVKLMKEINVTGFIVWGDDNFVWGNPDTIWRPPETAVYQRHFPRGTMRCRRKQVRLTNEVTILYRSDVFGLADVEYFTPSNPTKLTVVSQDIPWPTEIVDSFISFADDGYTNRYKISSRSDTTLIIVGGGLTPSIGKEWQIHDYNKDQGWELKGISMTYAPLSNVGDKYDKTHSKGNE